MIAQIVFFIAFALFITILVRRTNRNGSRVNLTNYLNRLTNLGGSFNRLARPGRVRRSAVLAPAPLAENQNEKEDFWHEQAVEEKPELLSNFEEAETLFKKGHYQEAEKLFLGAAQKNPKDARIYAKLGLIYLQTKNYNDAIESLKVATKLDKYNPSRRYNLALAYWYNKDHQRAIASIREAISLDPVTPKYRQFLERLLDKK